MVRTCIVICDHRNDMYLVGGIERFYPRSDIAWYNSGGMRPRPGSAGMWLTMLPQGRPLDYAEVTFFFLDMLEWAAGQSYGFIVNAETDMAFVQPGDERFIAEAMPEADHLAPGYARDVPRTSRWLPDPQRQGTAQFLLFDYSNHWLDICRYWLEPDPVEVVQAMTYEVTSGDNGLVQQSMWASLETAGGVNIAIRGAAAGISHAGIASSCKVTWELSEEMSTPATASTYVSMTAASKSANMWTVHGSPTASLDPWSSCCGASRRSRSRHTLSPKTARPLRWWRPSADPLGKAAPE